MAEKTIKVYGPIKPKFRLTDAEIKEIEKKQATKKRPVKKKKGK